MNSQGGLTSMKNMVSRVMAATAAAGLVFAPIAAQANTRAGDNTPVYTSNSTASQPGLAREAEGEEAGGKGSAIILLLFAAAAAIAGIAVIADDDSEEGQSPGT